MHTRCMIEFAAKNDLPVVLLIDDDMVSREVTATLLIMTGYTVHTADSGTAALEMLGGGTGKQGSVRNRKAAFQPEAILLDAQMPGLSGTRLIAKLRARTQARIYIISGSCPSGDLAAAADGFLLKPFDADSLRVLLKAEHVVSQIDHSEAAISAATLAQFRKLMPESAVRQIYVTVVDDLSRRIEALGAAIAKGDAAEVRRIGHAIKGGCGMAGALQAARLGALLESGDNQLDNSAALLPDLRAAARNLERILDSELPA